MTSAVSSSAHDQFLSDASEGRLVVQQGDALEFDWQNLLSDHVTTTPWEEGVPDTITVIVDKLLFLPLTAEADLHVLGNLPFSVSIPLLLQWLAAITTRSGPFQYGRCSLTLTFQSEVAEVSNGAME